MFSSLRQASLSLPCWDAGLGRARAAVCKDSDAGMEGLASSALQGRVPGAVPHDRNVKGLPATTEPSGKAQVGFCA